MKTLDNIRQSSVILILTLFLCNTALYSQKSQDYSKIDIMLIKGDFNKVIDTCRQILKTDSLNSEIYYKMGLAYQNYLPDDKSLSCFLKAADISPENNIYNFMVAKGYFNKGKMTLAAPILENLYAKDSLNWTYAYYLTTIYMQDKMYDESIQIYNKFFLKDSSNYIFLDRLGFAFLRKKEYPTAISFYNRSLELNRSNVSALKNLSFLYASTQRVDTALQLLGMGIKIDPSDMDLYFRRATLNYTLNYTKRAMDDYLKILGSGDSTVLYLKRVGIGYTYNLQPKEAIKYLLLAYKKDTTDLEVSRHLAENYEKIKDLKSSAFYYRHIINTLIPSIRLLSHFYVSLGETLRADGLYNESISAYLKGQTYGPDINITLIVANIYDEKLNNIPKAIQYYQLFFDNLKNNDTLYKLNYVESVKKRLDYLKQQQQK